MRCDTYGGPHGFRAKGVKSFDILSKEKVGAMLNNIEDIVGIQQEEQGPRKMPWITPLFANLSSHVQPLA